MDVRRKEPETRVLDRELTTRLGDVMLLIGIVLLWRQTGSFDLRQIFHAAEAGDIPKWYLTNLDKPLKVPS